MSDETLKPEETSAIETKNEVTLEDLPMHAIRAKAKELGIKTAPSDKKDDIIEKLVAGDDSPKEKKKVAFLPKDIRPQLEELAKKGLTWEIDEDQGCVNFHKDLWTCANLDQDSKGILQTAQQAFGRARLSQVGVTGDRGHRPVEWA